MLSDILNINKLFPFNEENEEIRSLVLLAEAKIRHLNDIPLVAADNNSVDIVTILKSICLLLDRSIEAREKDRVREEGENRSIELDRDNLAIDRLELDIDTKDSIAELSKEYLQIAENIVPKLDSNLEPSPTTKELIKLRDWILFAKNNNSTDSSILNNLYQRLGHILAKEEIISLEAEEKFDCDRHQIIDTKITENIDLDDFIYSTIRPGYLFKNMLLRPQEVIVYKFDT
jgi:molecular chaperone GrpE (heat shock protein)